MTDKPVKPDPTSPSPEDDDLGLGSERQLSETLDRATELAADLCQDVGANVSTGIPVVSSSDATAVPALDAALSELESLVEETNQRLGEVGTPTHAPRDESAMTSEKPSAPATPAPASDDYHVPDFMAEFLEPDSVRVDSLSAPRPTTPIPTAASKPPPSSLKTTPTKVAELPPSPKKPGIVETGGVAATVVDPQKSQVTAPSATGQPAAEPGSRMPAATAKSHWSKIITPAEAPALKAASFAATAIEIMDRPLQRMGEGVRRVVGWFALATFALALITFLITML